MMHEFHAVVLHPDGSIKHDIVFKRHIFTHLDAAARSVPASLTFKAAWLANITTGKILKNRTGQIYLHLCSDEVDHAWLVDHGYAASARRSPHI